jgi:ATP-binding cassette subfamily B protein
VFNQDLFIDARQPFLYEYVENGTWTLDKQASLAPLFYRDTNGDGQQDPTDYYGLVTAHHAHMDPYWASCEVGIVGKTGSGKSTLVNLLARLYDPSEGSITLDGHNLKDIFMGDLRKNIGIVSQEIYLFSGSIADNIRYARPEASMEEVISAAKAASAHDFIMKLPDGYETRVGSGGQDLSGGEKQRISIARTVIQNPGILILDEATAAMDTETERRIQESIHSLQEGRTTIAIAHRLSTLRDADVLAVIDQGEMKEYGTHEELMKLEGVYHKLYTLQQEAIKHIAIAE